MIKKQSVMVLGALGDETYLVENFQKRGYRVIVVGYGGGYPCEKLADRYYDIDIRNKNGLIEIARKEKIVAVASNVVSIAVEMTSWLAREINVPGIPYDVARAFTNKAIMREKTSIEGVKNPLFLWARDVNEALSFAKDVGYPLIMKPVDGNSSKGVIKIWNDKEIYQFFDESANFSLNDKGVIIEEFILGEEYIVDGFSINGQCVCTDIGYKEHFFVNNRFISKSVVIQDAPHCITKIEEKLKEAHKKTVDALRLPYGPTHGEYIYCPIDESVYLVEVAARGGGIRLSSDMIPLATGLDISDLIVNHALGGTDPRMLNIHKGAAAWFAFALKEGVVTKVSGIDECLKIDGVHYIETEGLQVGRKSRSLVNDSGKYAPIITYGSDRNECREIFDKVKEVIRVEVNGEYGMIW